MLETTKNFIEVLDSFMDTCFKQMSIDSFKQMNQNDIELMHKFIMLSGATKDLLVEESKKLDDIDRKLDLVLESLSKN